MHLRFFHTGSGMVRRGRSAPHSTVYCAAVAVFTLELSICIALRRRTGAEAHRVVSCHAGSGLKEPLGGAFIL